MARLGLALQYAIIGIIVALGCILWGTMGAAGGFAWASFVFQSIDVGVIGALTGFAGGCVFALADLRHYLKTHSRSL